jgi:putative hydrolase of the HAD superfamily
VLRAAIFDVGGVLVQLDWRAALAPWDKRCGLRPGGVLDELFRGFDDTVLVGRIEPAEHWARAWQRLGLTDDEGAKLMEDLASAERFNTELEAYIAMRPHYKTAIVSNGWTDARTARHRSRLERLVDEIVISAEVGVAKPSPRIFEIALERLGVPAASAVYVDDQPDMLAAARAVGLHAVAFESNEQVREELSSTLLSVDPFS